MRGLQNLLLGPKMIQGSPTAECRTYSESLMKALISLAQMELLLSVSVLCFRCDLVYCTVRLRFPEDHIIKKCIDFITENVTSFDAKDTSLTLWALAKMHYPSSYVQNLMLRKVQSQVEHCLKDHSLFSTSGDP